MVLLLSCLTPARGFSETNATWGVDLYVGHDDNILAETDLGVGVEEVSSAFFSGSSRFLFQWDDAWKNYRLELIAEASGTTYGSNVDGGDGDLTVVGAYRHRLYPKWILDVSGSNIRFRRGEQLTVDSTRTDPVFDFDLWRLEARVGWVPSASWLFTAGAEHNWISFPGRFTDPEGRVEEDQRQLSLSLAAMRRASNGSFLMGETIYRRTTSNSPDSEYDGPILWIRSRFPIWRRLFLSAYAGFGHRSYDQHMILSDSTSIRDDETWQYGVTLSRSLSRQATVFLDGSYLHQVSNVPSADFDQAQVSLGVSITFISTRGKAIFSQESSALAPAVTKEGTRFRFVGRPRHSVSVVGGFNGWDPSRNPLIPTGEPGVWETVIPLPEGIWRYAFVVDGVWVTPPDAPRYEDDGFGGRNGVLEVRANKEDSSVTNEQKSRQKE